MLKCDRLQLSQPLTEAEAEGGSRQELRLAEDKSDHLEKITDFKTYVKVTFNIQNTLHRTISNPSRV